ncbi:MAG: hypothetical protein GY940_40515, partial [bacterium]|nr:hypothetical protein [bacterium]
GPLMKAGLFKTGTGHHLLIVIHHLVTDGVSWRILLEDFKTGYQQEQKGEEIKFPEKTDSYRQWARQLSQYAASNEILDQLDYWRKIENAALEPLPADQIVEKEKKIVANQAVERMMLSQKETVLLKTEANKAYNTEINDILLTALAAAIGEWTNREQVSINLEGHGREAIIEGINITRTLGWFTTQFPVLLDTGKSNPLSVGENVKKIKETL